MKISPSRSRKGPGYASPTLHRHPRSTDHPSLWITSATSSARPYPLLFTIRRNVSGATRHGGAWLHDPSRSKIKVPFIRKDSSLQTIFAPPGDFRREKPRRHSGEGIPRGPGGKRTAPAGAEKVIEFCMKKVVG